MPRPCTTGSGSAPRRSAAGAKHAQAALAASIVSEWASVPARSAMLPARACSDRCARAANGSWRRACRFWRQHAEVGRAADRMVGGVRGPRSPARPPPASAGSSMPAMIFEVDAARGEQRQHCARSRLGCGAAGCAGRAHGVRLPAGFVPAIAGSELQVLIRPHARLVSNERACDRNWRARDPRVGAGIRYARSHPQPAAAAGAARARPASASTR